ncbi:MAG: potassium channel family protein [Pirellulales bacterium]
MPERDRTELQKFLKGNRHCVMLLSLLALVIIQPFFSHSAVGIFVGDLLFSLVIMASVFDIGIRKKRWTVSIIVALPALGFMWSLQAFDQTNNYDALVWWLILRNLLMIGFLCYTTVLLMQEVFSTDEITQEEILGGISAYLLLGLIWAYLYTTVLIYDHDAIDFPPLEEITVEMEDSIKARAYHEVGSLVYFSYVTLTTLGYGDITPRSPIARTLAWLEAGIGQLFIAVMMARLVGLRVAVMIEQRRNKDEK